jgi:hypothetical protein
MVREVRRKRLCGHFGGHPHFGHGLNLRVR